ncbi:MAG: hypothetical protein HXX20_11785 [Chloroflexi bacterium]|nr:hypothetical protein [Chloroflexota bacterium]
MEDQLAAQPVDPVGAASHQAGHLVLRDDLYSLDMAPPIDLPSRPVLKDDINYFSG